jgi:formylglycine-generating enzyme required for sulfatase activity
MRDHSIPRIAPALVLAALIAAPALALAQPGMRRGERYALLVGVRAYDPNELHDLAYSEADVTGLAAVLGAGGYEPGNVVLMTQTLGATKPRSLPLAANIRKELKLLLRDLEPADSVVVAFAGHGVQFAGEKSTYFCPADAKLADRSTLIPLDDVYRELEASKAGLKMLLVDACRNDPRTKNSRSRAEVELESLDRPQVVPPPGGVLAFFSCSEGEKAQEYEELKHGVFFHFVIQGLEGGADLDGDNLISPEELAQYARRRVRDYVRDKNGVRQMPELRGTSRDLVSLVRLSRPRTPDVAPPRLSRANEPRAPITNSLGMRLVPIPAGEFLMGSSDDEDADDDEKPQHRVRITRPFYLGTTEVTVGQFRRFVEAMGYRTEAERNGRGGRGWNESRATFEVDPKYTWRDPGFPQTDEHPVTNVSWNDAVAFCEWLSRTEATTYRLPTEAEWEYACRAGTTTRYSSGADPETLAAVGNVADGTARAKFPNWKSTIVARDGHVFTAPGGTFRANAWGLHDMHGNVWEWCLDGYDGRYYEQSPGADPTGPSQASRRVYRGGSWADDPRYARSARRVPVKPDYREYDVGFRVARVP